NTEGKKKHRNGTFSIIIQAGAALQIARTLIALLHLCVKFLLKYKSIEKFRIGECREELIEF
ncbi:MAG: hypothetical protein AB1798_14090, partial [Spirochaetota bacterium]